MDPTFRVKGHRMLGDVALMANFPKRRCGSAAGHIAGRSVYLATGPILDVDLE